METIGSEGPLDLALLKRCLLTIAITYGALGALLMLMEAGSPLSVAGRVLIVCLLCVQVAKGHNWARLLLGAFTVLVSAVILLSTSLSFLSSVRGILLAVLALALGGTYIALFAHPAIRAQFQSARARRTSVVAAH